MTDRTPRLLVSLSWTWSIGVPAELSERIVLQSRTSTWGLGRLHAFRRECSDIWSLARRARRGDTVVLGTLGLEVAALALLVRARSPHCRVVVFDFLAPRRTLPLNLGALINLVVHRFVVIRRGDVAMLKRRFATPAHRCVYVAWPVDVAAVPREVSDGDYVYSAGWAHRDWTLLLDALGRCQLRAVIAPGPALVLESGLPQLVQVIDMPSPDDGRALAASARIVAVAMKETDLPSGPLVLLDALAMGKPVVVSDVNGTRDYVVDGVNALVVPADDPEAFAEAVNRLDGDTGLRLSLGARAQADVLRHHSPPVFWSSLLSALLEAPPPRRHRDRSVLGTDRRHTTAL